MISLFRPKHVVPWHNDNVYVVIDGLCVLIYMRVTAGCVVLLKSVRSGET